MLLGRELIIASHQVEDTTYFNLYPVPSIGIRMTALLGYLPVSTRRGMSEAWLWKWMQGAEKCDGS
jgi:hypothetical protein